MFARTKVDEFFRHKIKSIACLFDAYLFLLAYIPLLLCLSRRVDWKKPVLFWEEGPPWLHLLSFLETREKERLTSIQPFSPEQLFLLFFSILFRFKFFKSASFFFLAQNTFDAGQRGYDVAAALVVLYDRIKIMENRALSFVHSSSMAR